MCNSASVPSTISNTTDMFFCTWPLHWPLSTPSFDTGGSYNMTSFPISPRQPLRAPWTHDHLVHIRALALGCAIEPGMASSYSSALQSYLAFCKSHDFPIDPTPDTLSFYIVFMCHHIKPNSIKSYLSGHCTGTNGKGIREDTGVGTNE